MYQDKSDIKFNNYNIESFTLTPIEQVPMLNTNREDSKKLGLERETFWIDTLDTLEPQGLNRKRSEDIVKNSQNGEVFLSKTANMASRIIKKHFTLLKDHHEFEDYEYQIISAYSKHRNIFDVVA